MSEASRQAVLTSTRGDTVLLRLRTDGSALFSLDGGVTWFPVTQESGGGGQSYLFGYGLTKLGNEVMIDTSVVPTWIDLREESSSSED